MNFFSIFVGHFALLYPDPDCNPDPGTQLNLDPGTQLNPDPQHCYFEKAIFYPQAAFFLQLF